MLVIFGRRVRAEPYQVSFDPVQKFLPEILVRFTNNNNLRVSQSNLHHFFSQPSQCYLQNVLLALQPTLASPYQ